MNQYIIKDPDRSHDRTPVEIDDTVPGLSPEAFPGADPLQANPLYEDYFFFCLIFAFVTILFV
jgi:hypothetical protein